MSTYIRQKELSSGKSRYYVTAVADGHHYGCGGFDRKKDAEERCRLVDGRLAAGTFRQELVKQEESLPFKNFATSWLNEKDKNLKPGSARSYRDTFNLHVLPYLGEMKLNDITPTDIQEWVNKLGKVKQRNKKNLAPATIGKAYRYLRACLKNAEDRDLIDRCPCRGINLPKVPKEEMDFLSPDEVGRLLEKAEGTYRDLFTVLAYSGLRLGEGLALRWRDIDFGMNAIKVNRSLCTLSGEFQEPKTRSSRRAVRMLPRLRTHLTAMQHGQAPDDLLFKSKSGTHLDASNCRRAFEVALEAAKLKDVTVHSLRHTYTSTMLAAGESIKRIQHDLGHSSITMTMDTYGHLIPDGSGEALLRADALFGGPKTGVAELRRAE